MRTQKNAAQIRLWNSAIHAVAHLLNSDIAKLLY